MAAGTKRAHEDSAAPKAKKTKVDHKPQKRQSLGDKPAQATSSLLTEETDFPRGGGTSFTPLEVKAIRAEAVKEANEELFHVMHSTPIPSLVCSLIITGQRVQGCQEGQEEVRGKEEGQEESWPGRKGGDSCAD